MLYLQINIFQKGGKISIYIINRNDDYDLFLQQQKIKGTIVE